jgi:hypothetical protein
MDCPDHAGLPVPNRSRAAGRTADSRAGDHRPLASPVELPLIEQPMTGQEARRLRPSQARPHDCSSTSQDSRRLGREPKTTRRVWIPSLTNGRQPTQSTEAECPPRTATATVGQGVSVNRAGAPAIPAPGDHPLLTWHTLGRSRDDFVSITSQPRAPFQFTQRVRRLGCDPASSSGPPTRRSRKTSRPTSVRLSQRARRYAGNTPTWSGRDDHSTISTTGPTTAQLSRQVTLQGQHFDSESRTNQVGRTYPTAQD